MSFLLPQVINDKRKQLERYVMLLRNDPVLSKRLKDYNQIDISKLSTDQLERLISDMEDKVSEGNDRIT